MKFESSCGLYCKAFCPCLSFFFYRVLVAGVFFFLQDSRKKSTDPIVEDEVVVPDFFNRCVQSRNGQRTVLEEEVLPNIQSLEFGRTILAV